MFVLMLIENIVAHLMDVHEAFLLEHFKNEKQICLEVPQKFEKNYFEIFVLLLMKTIYGLKQSETAF